MKQKTAMMEYFEYAEHQGVVFTDDFKNYYLEKEEQQIINAYSKDNSTYWPHYKRFEKANQYFNETYGE